VVAIAFPRAAPADFLALAKPRIVVLVMVTVAAGFYLAPPPMLPAAARLLLLGHVLIGTALITAGASAFNQLLERDADALMRRTAGRPLPAGRLTVAEAGIFACSVASLGAAQLALFVNAQTAAIAALTLVAYVGIYTPLKRRTPLSTLVGAVPGALPIVGGWTAAGGTLGVQVSSLFWILFLWQLPHFLALSWIYRADYARAGFATLSVADDDGGSTFRQSALGAAALIPASLTPTLLGIAGTVYFFGALLLSLWFAGIAVVAARHRSAPSARRVFMASLAYLPILLALMVADSVS
jgi:heme o synthase